MILKGIVRNGIYVHFLYLSIEMSILLESCDHERTERLTYAKELLFYFVVNAADLYGETFTVYNVHNLIHLSGDVTHFHTSLDWIS